MKYNAYTDGSYQSSINAGGYAAFIFDEKGMFITKLYQGYKNTTNNRMEALGVLAVLQYFTEPTIIDIYSDSQYIVKSIESGSAKKWIEENDLSKKNLDIWSEIVELLDFHTVYMHWVKGHADNIWNEMADKLAVHAAQCLNIPIDQQTYDNNNYNKENW